MTCTQFYAIKAQDKQNCFVHRVVCLTFRRVNFNTELEIEIEVTLLIPVGKFIGHSSNVILVQDNIAG